MWLGSQVGLAVLVQKKENFACDRKLRPGRRQEEEEASGWRLTAPPTSALAQAGVPGASVMIRLLPHQARFEPDAGTGRRCQPRRAARPVRRGVAIRFETNSPKCSLRRMAKVMQLA